MPRRRFVVISYDITDNRRRIRVMKTLEGYGTRVQYSVFEAWLTRRQLLELRERLLQILQPKEDSVRFYFLNRADVQRIWVLGQGQVTEERHMYIV